MAPTGKTSSQFAEAADGLWPGSSLLAGVVGLELLAHCSGIGSRGVLVYPPLRAPRFNWPHFRPARRLENTLSANTAEGLRSK